MMSVRLFFCMVTTLISVGVTRAQEYVYPVASFTKEGQEWVYLFYQKSLKHIELWLWNPQAHCAQKALLSSYTPAGLRILPDQSGFSFVDNDRIRIKEFAKRSPRSIDIYEPIYDIGIVEWMDSTHGYFSAKQEDKSALFLLDRVTENVVCLAKLRNGDCLYPVVLGNELFYIERIHPDGHYRCISGHSCRYRIMHAPFAQDILKCEKDNFNNKENFDDRIANIIAQRAERYERNSLITEDQTTLVLDFDREALAFLRMESSTCGYVLTHASSIEKSDVELPIDYYKISKKGGVWQRQLLFSFIIPLSLLLPESPARLYESLLPLLPKHYNSHIYFVDSNENAILNLCYYDIASGNSNIVWHGKLPGECCFVPFLVGDSLYCGGTLKADGAPNLYFGLDGEMKCDLLNLNKEKKCQN